MLGLESDGADAAGEGGPGAEEKPRKLGRYIVHRELASGGMASVWLARQRGDGDFSRVVAIKQLFPQYAKDPQFVAMFRDEARLAARVRHPNVVPTIDVVAADGEVFLVMEYVAGESLSRLLAAARRKAGGKEEKARLDGAIASNIVIGVLEGLHAAHQATNERGVPLQIVHRDMSPQNVIVGSDGVPRVVDFGIAKAIGRQQETTQTGQLKGKICYMSPEQVGGAKSLDRRCDLWAVSVMLWEMLAGRQLFEDAPAALRYHAKIDAIPPPFEGVPAALQAVLDRGLARDADARFATAREMIAALEKALPPAPTRLVAQWVQKLARDTLRERAELILELEALSGSVRAANPNVDEHAGADPAAPSTVPLLRSADPVAEPVETLVLGPSPTNPPAPLPSSPPHATALTSAAAVAVTSPASSSKRGALVVLGALLLVVVGAVVILPRALARSTTTTTNENAPRATAALATATSAPSAPAPAISTSVAPPASITSSSPLVSSTAAPKRRVTGSPRGSSPRPATTTTDDPLDHASRK